MKLLSNLGKEAARWAGLRNESQSQFPQFFNDSKRVCSATRVVSGRIGHDDRRRIVVRCISRICWCEIVDCRWSCCWICFLFSGFFDQSYRDALMHQVEWIDPIFLYVFLNLFFRIDFAFFFSLRKTESGVLVSKRRVCRSNAIYRCRLIWRLQNNRFLSFNNVIIVHRRSSSNIGCVVGVACKRSAIGCVVCR